MGHLKPVIFLMFIGVPIFKNIIIRLILSVANSIRNEPRFLGHLIIINFPFGTNGKLIIFGILIL